MNIKSLSARRVWIEIATSAGAEDKEESLSARRVWIEIGYPLMTLPSLSSLSARRVWIEILVRLTVTLVVSVTLCEESVD